MLLVTTNNLQHTRQGFLDDLFSGLNKAGYVANQSLDLYDKFNKVAGSSAIAG
jgi:hypothetical protein